MKTISDCIAELHALYVKHGDIEVRHDHTDNEPVIEYHYEPGEDGHEIVVIA
jgi:hypothetical protein